MYDWLVLLHVLGAFGFFLAHGASAAVMFRVQAERQPARLHALLDLSRGVGGAMALTLLLTGVIGGFMGTWWDKGWIWTALGLLIAISVVMSWLGRLYLDRVRHAIGVATGDDVRKKLVPPPPLPPEQLCALLASGRPGVLAGVGLGGLAVITWLMILKPF